MSEALNSLSSRKIITLCKKASYYILDLEPISIQPEREVAFKSAMASKR